MNDTINGTINSTLAATVPTVIATISAGEQGMRTTFIVIAIIYILVMIVAIPGNLLIIWITLANKTMRSPINLLVCNLAVAGLIIACIRMPIKVYELIYPIQTLFHYPFGVFVCKLAQVIPAICLQSISITLTTICIDRYLSIVYPTRRKLRMNLVKVYIFLPCCWLLSFLSWIPYGTYMNIYKIGSSYKRCLLGWPKNSYLDINITNSHGISIYYFSFSQLVFWVFFITLVFLLPVIIMVTLYAIVVKKLQQKGPVHQHSVQRYDANGRQTIAARQHTCTKDSQGLKVKKRVIKIFITCLVLFIVTNLPYYFILALISFKIIIIQDFYLVYSVNNVLIIINYTCIAYNAIIYGYFNKNYRTNAPSWLHYITHLSSLSCVNFVAPVPGNVATQLRTDQESVKS